jgi:hypothetical protein
MVTVWKFALLQVHYSNLSENAVIIAVADVNKK